MISVIIPVYNEALTLPATLQRLEKQTAAHEVIIVDGGSHDRTCDIARASPRVRLLVANKGRATQMNAGAHLAQGEWLVFLHADTLLPDNALNHIAGLPAHIQAGGFRHCFSGHDWRLRLISGINNMRCRITRIIYGDQALFVRRHLHARLGGFPELPFLEDIAFGERLLHVTHPLLLDMAAVTDARRFIKCGVWRSLWRVAVILLRAQLHLPARNNAFFDDVR